MRKPRRGFTLIELLIVVAIIAILAAIAVPNFLEAQTRAKVSRVLSDLRVLATGVEAYAIDNNLYPPTSGSGQRGFPEEAFGVPLVGTLSYDLSTPVAYITNAFLVDPFNIMGSVSLANDTLYAWQNLRDQYCGTAYFGGTDMLSAAFCEDALEFYGAWRMNSVGPDQDFGFEAGISAQIPYDATNGTVSLGNIWRSQRNPDASALANPADFPNL